MIQMSIDLSRARQQRNTMHPINKPHDVAHTIIAPLCFVFLVLGIQIAVILIRNDGIFSYILDDAYIHMALAEQIANGHYGINAGEYASPSSSILWPFLLAPFAHTSFFEWVPLLIHLSC